MFIKQQKARHYEYTPRFYQPTSDDDNEKRRITFRRLTERKPVAKRSFLGMVIIIVILIFLIRFLVTAVKSDKEEFKFEDTKIEAIE